MTKLEERALRILRGYGDPACYEEMTSAITRGQADVLEAKEPGVMLRHRRAGVYMMAGHPYRMLNMAMSLRGQEDDALLHGAMPADNVMGIKRTLGREHAYTYINFAYYGELPPEQEGADIRPLTLEHLDFVYENYGHASREYLKARIEDGVMIGAFVDGVQAGFIGEHVEGSMGLLHIMPEFRRHHLGFALEQEDIRRTMLRGHTPFCQVAAYNSASLRLQKRLGLTQAQGVVYWLTNEEM